MKYLYLLIDIFSLALPLIFSFHPKINFIKHWKSLWPALLITSILFIGWDILYTHLGIWGFNPKYIIGVYLFNLPIEEVLFFICIPYSSLFIYHLVSKSSLADKINPQIISIIIAVVLIDVAVFNIHKLYTMATFALLSIFVLSLQLIYKPKYMARFYVSFLFIMIPFFMVNGILTGSFIHEEVVWYNAEHHLNLRAGTIPVEDVFYGMLLVLTNVFLYERFMARKLG